MRSAHLLRRVLVAATLSAAPLAVAAPTGAGTTHPATPTMVGGVVDCTAPLPGGSIVAEVRVSDASLLLPGNAAEGCGGEGPHLRVVIGPNARGSYWGEEYGDDSCFPPQLCIAKEIVRPGDPVSVKGRLLTYRVHHGGRTVRTYRAFDTQRLVVGNTEGTGLG